MSKKIKFSKNNNEFMDSALVNDATYFDYLERLKKIALSMFEWVNLPKSMNSMYLEKCLYYNGMATLLKDENYGFINTRCAGSGHVNIYGLPTKLNCYSYDYQEIRDLYNGLEENNDEMKDCILVQNNWEKIPTSVTLELFALRLYEAERTCDVNIKNQKFPVLITVDDSQRLMMENLYSQIDGNKPAIFGDKKQLDPDMIKAINTGSPYVADKITEYKKEIFNEALTFLGINNIMVEKKERLISDEASSNNELINLNLQSYLVPRQLACEQFNEKYGLKGTDKEISVRLRSDLHNIIKNSQTNVIDYKNNINDKNKIEKEVE